MKKIVIVYSASRYHVYRYRENGVNADLISSFSDKAQALSYVYDRFGCECPVEYIFGALVTEDYIKKVEVKCDSLASSLDSLGTLKFGAVKSEYRESACWKDEPLNYCYDCAYWELPEDCFEGRIKMYQLFGIDIALRNLGFILTFDGFHKHRIFGSKAYFQYIDRDLVFASLF